MPVVLRGCSADLNAAPVRSKFAGVPQQDRCRGMYDGGGSTQEAGPRQHRNAQMVHTTVQRYHRGESRKGTSLGRARCTRSIVFVLTWKSVSLLSTSIVEEGCETWRLF